MSHSANLLPKVAAGEQPAVALCVKQYGPLVWSLALRYFRDRHEAEDAVQEVFVEVWKSAGRFDPNVASEKTFIAMIARRRLIDRLRSAGRHKPTTEISQIHEPSAESEDPVETADEVARARAALRALPTEQRDVLIMAIDRGMTHSQIAEELGQPLGTVKTRVRRGLIAVREMLTARGTEVGS